MTGISQDLSSWPLRTTQPVRMGHAPHSFPIRRLAEDPAHVLDRRRWPGDLPPVAQVLDQGLDLTPATIFVAKLGRENPLSWKPLHWLMACLQKADLPGPATAPDPRSPYLPITCSLSATPVPQDAAISCARKQCTASSPISRRTRAPWVRTSRSTTCHTANRSWNWQWIVSGDADCGCSMNRNQRCNSRDASASSRS